METLSSAEVSLLSNSAVASAAAARPQHCWAAPPLSAYCRPENTVRLTDAHPTQVICTKYELLDPSLSLGHGASSTVRLAYRRRDGQPVAVKTIAKHDALGLWSKTHRWQVGARRSMSSPRDAAGEIRQQFKRAPRLDEVDVLTSLGDCLDIVQLLDVYETHQEVQLVMEYCEGGDLFDCIKRRKQFELEPESPEAEPLRRGGFTELETATAAKTLLGVLDTLHSRNIVHRDVKPENIMILDDDDPLTQLGAVNLTDFGMARLLHDDTSSTANADEEDLSAKKRSRAYSCVGSDYYAAPEILMGSGYGVEVDIYSLGITLFVMLCGTPPSSTSFFKFAEAAVNDGDSSCIAVPDESTLSSQCSELDNPFPSNLNISTSAQDLISKMIHPDPGKRIIASEALKHEWIKHSVNKDTHMCHASKLSSSLNSDNIVPRAMSFVGTKLLLPNSLNNFEQTSEVSSTSISLTLAAVCDKLAPLVDDRQHKKRKHHTRSHPDGVDFTLMSSRTHSRSGDKLGIHNQSRNLPKRRYVSAAE